MKGKICNVALLTSQSVAVLANKLVKNNAVTYPNSLVNAGVCIQEFTILHS